MRIISDPREIEKRSFEIIDKFLSEPTFSKSQRDVIKRIVHASADLNYIKELKFHSSAIEAGVAAITKGKNIIVDASMVKAGINKNLLSKFGASVFCFINDKDVVRQSAKLKITRSTLAMRKAAKLMDGAIVAIGNAPTALFELCSLVKQGKAKPALIVGVPVGFVGAVCSKKELRSLKIPYITNKSKKGGSSIAAACVNALLKIAEKKEK